MTHGLSFRWLWTLLAVLPCCGLFVLDPLPETAAPPAHDGGGLPEAIPPDAGAPPPDAEPMPDGGAGGQPCTRVQDCPENRTLPECHLSLCAEGRCRVAPSSAEQWCNDGTGLCSGAPDGAGPTCERPASCLAAGCTFLYCDAFSWCQWEPMANGAACPVGSCLQGMCCP